MCAPIAFAAVSAGLQLASSFARSRAIRAEGEAANNYYQYQAKVQEQNAILAERTGKAQSRAIQDVQKLKGRQLKLSQAQFRASQEAALAASGIPLSSVTSGDIARSTINKQALDEATLRFNSDVRSFGALTGAQNQAFDFRTRANTNRIAGQNAIYSSRVNARNTLLGGAVGAFTPFLFSPFASASRGTNIGSGITSFGIRAPSRFIPPR